MKITKTSRTMALILALMMSISAFGAIGISAEEETPEAATCFDMLLSENGYGFGDVTANGGDAIRNQIYSDSGLYWEPNALLVLKRFTTDTETGKLVESTDNTGDVKLFINAVGNNANKAKIISIQDSTHGNPENYVESRYLTDMLCSDTGYDHYTLEMDLAITGDANGTKDANAYDFSYYRGFSLIYLFSSGWSVKATGLGVADSITYDDDIYVENKTNDTYNDSYSIDSEATEGGFYKVTAVGDRKTEYAERGFLYTPGYSSSYICDDGEVLDKLGSKATSQASGTFDTTAAIDFNKIAAAGKTPVAYYKGVEGTLRMEFVRTEVVSGHYNDKFTVTIWYDDKDGNETEIGQVSYTTTVAARKLGIAFCDMREMGVTIDNIKLSVDTESDFRCDGLHDGANYFNKDYQTGAIDSIVNTYNGFSARTACADCNKKGFFMMPEKIIENNITDVIGKSYTINDTQSIVKGSGTYWVATDIHATVDYTAPAEASTLLTIGGNAVLKHDTNGNILLGDGTTTGKMLTAKSSYAVAVRVIPGSKYEVYLNGKLAGSATFATATTDTIVLNATDSGIRLLNVKALTLADPVQITLPTVISKLDMEADYCAHTEDTTKARTFYKTPIVGVENFHSTLMSYSYECKDCGQTVHVALGDNLVTAISKAALQQGYSVTVTGTSDDAGGTVTLETGSTSAKEGAYWVSFKLDFANANPEGLVNFKKTAGHGNLFNVGTNYTSMLRFYTISDTSTGNYANTDEILAAVNAGTLKNNLTTGYDENYLALKYQGAGTDKFIAIIKAGGSYDFAVRITPDNATGGTGKVEIYLDGKLASTTSTGTSGSTENAKASLRLGMYGSAVISDLAVVRDAHYHSNEYSADALLQTDTELNYSYLCCGREETTAISSINTNNIKNVSSGYEEITISRNTDYWIATDINVRSAVTSGALITLGNGTDSYKLLEIADGKFKSGSYTGDTVSAPGTYSVAIRVMDRHYDLYIENEFVCSGILNGRAYTKLTFGDDAFNYSVRFNYNKVVTLGTGTPKVPTFQKDNVGTVCYHYNTAKTYESFSTKLVNEKEHGGNPNTDNKVNLLYTTYICGGCGERVYNAEQGRNLYNVDSKYYAKGVDASSGRAQYNTVFQNGNREASGTFRVDSNASITQSGKPYWVYFNVEAVSLNPAGLTNGSSTQGNFFNIMVDFNSVIRAYKVRSSVNESTALSDIKTSGSDFEISSNYSTDYILLRDKQSGDNIALMGVGDILEIAIWTDPLTGATNTYCNGVLMATGTHKAGFNTANDGGFSLRFFDVSYGTFKFSDFAFVEAADSYVDYDGMSVVEATVTHTAVADATTYTDVFTSGNTSLLAIEDKTGKLVIPNGGSYTELYDVDNQPIIVSSAAVKLGLVNNGGKFNYYVNDFLARTVVPNHEEGIGVEYAQNIEFAGEGMAEINIGKDVKLTSNYGIGGTGTAEYIANQLPLESEITKNQIRIIAGVNSKYHGNVGFKVTNTTTGKTVDPIFDTNIYSSVEAGGNTVKATEYGYTYFTVFIINGIDMDKDSVNTISITPYTTVGKDAPKEGTTKQLTITVKAPEEGAERTITIN